jgi:hypothetical protein
MPLIDYANAYLAAGLSVVPADKTAKRPSLRSWRPYQELRPSPDEVANWFPAATAIGLICGRVSGNLEMIDFDTAGEAFEPWCSIVNERAPGLLERLVIESTPSGGKHVVYQCQVAVCGNEKLAARSIPCPDGDSVVVAGKTLRPRQVDGQWFAETCLIETRGEGGFFLCAPTPGYELIHGRLDQLATITEAERVILLESALALDEARPTVAPERHAPIIQATGERPGDVYNGLEEWRGVLERHGWTHIRNAGNNEHWRRPGKSDGMSATFSPTHRTLYVFSSNAPPFEPNRAYSPFAIFAILEHGGDYHAAACSLASLGMGSEPDYGVDLSQWGKPIDEPAPAAKVEPFPEHLLNVPGFIGEVVAYNLATATRPQPVLALAGAIALQAVLAGRKVREYRGNAPNVYIVGLAPSGAGKDHARHVAKQVLIAAGCVELEGGEEIASAAGLASSVQENPAIMFQVDELGRFLKNSGDQSRNPHLFEIVSSLMKLYSAARGLWKGKAYSDAKRNREVAQPCVVLHGTTTPETFFSALTADNLADGFIGRLLVFNAPAEKPERQKAPHREPPASITEAARWWTDASGGGYPTAFNAQHPTPREVPTTPEAERVFDELVAIADAEQARPNQPGGPVWARAEEKALRLALIYACSADRQQPVIDEPAARWAADVVLHLTRRVLMMADDWIADTPFAKRQGEVLRAIKRLGSPTKGELTRATQSMSVRERDEVLANLTQANRVVMDVSGHAGAGRPLTTYRLA